MVVCVVLTLGIASCSSDSATPKTTTTTVHRTDRTSSTFTPTGAVGNSAWIVFEWEIPGNSDGAYLVRPDGTGEHRILADLSIDQELVHPDWSRDGKRLVFGRGPGGPTSQGPKSIWIVDADGQHGRTLVGCGGFCVGVENPAWSPDGSKVAYTDHETTGTKIVVVDVTTGIRTQLTPISLPDQAYGRARWAPDGHRLVVEMEKYANGELTGSRLAIVDFTAAARDLKEVVPLPITDWSMFASFPDWHPSKDVIVFSTFDLSAFQNSDRPSNLFTIRDDGTGLTQLTHLGSNGIRATQPTWTSDGRRIMFTRVGGAADQDRSPAFVDADGTHLERVPVRRGATHNRLRPSP